MASAPSVLVTLDPAGATPLYRQVYERLRGAILSGRLAARAQLPSSRLLALELDIARTTVALAYDQLRAEGYLETHERGGTFVARVVPDQALAAGVLRRRSTVRLTHWPSSGRAAAPLTPGSPSARGAHLGRLVSPSLAASARSPRPFRHGVPALDAFPHAVWAKLTARVWRHPSRALLAYSLPNGLPRLRRAIAEYITAARGARCTSEQVIVVGGSQQALDLAARVLLDPGDAVWLEDPGYPGARNALLAAGAGVVPVPIDAEGLSVAAGMQTAPHARLTYITPSHQYPLGVTMSIGRRLSLLEWAHRAGAWVLEDDYDSEFRYTSRPLPCLQGLDADTAGAAARVIYIGSFSKTLFPALRIGFLVAPPALVDVFAAARAVADRQSPSVDQVVLAEFITEGHFVRHLRRMRALYAERQHALLARAAQGPLSDHLELAPADAGMHLVGWLRDGRSDVDASARALRAGVETPALSPHALRPTERGALLLGYAAYSPKSIERAADRLALALSAKGTALHSTRGTR